MWKSHSSKAESERKRWSLCSKNLEMKGRQEGDGRGYGVKESFLFFFRTRAIWACLQDGERVSKEKDSL